MSSGMIRRRRRERNAIIPRSRVYRDRSNPLETNTLDLGIIAFLSLLRLLIIPDDILDFE
jgi:hypothetical protein